jgi:hypothetical protein
VVSRKGSFTGPVDDALEALGLRREVVAVVPGLPNALRIARQSDLVALVLRSCLDGGLTGAEPLTQGLVHFELRVPTPEIVIDVTSPHGCRSGPSLVAQYRNWSVPNDSAAIFVKVGGRGPHAVVPSRGVSPIARTSEITAYIVDK